MSLIDFIHESNLCNNPDDLTQKFLKFLAGYGLDRFVMSEMSHDTTTQKEHHHGVLVNYPQEWMEHYVSNHYIESDPVYQSALTARRPFTWQEATLSRNTTKKGVQVMNEARENKLYDGIAISIHQPLGGIIGMGISASETGVNLSRDSLSMLHAAANQFFLVYADLTDWQKLGDAPELTLREREILLWLAKGKSRGTIADILSISESSINRHSEKILLKMDTNTMTLAIAKAIRIGLISPF